MAIGEWKAYLLGFVGGSPHSAVPEGRGTRTTSQSSASFAVASAERRFYRGTSVQTLLTNEGQLRCSQSTPPVCRPAVVLLRGASPLRSSSERRPNSADLSSTGAICTHHRSLLLLEIIPCLGEAGQAKGCYNDDANKWTSEKKRILSKDRIDPIRWCIRVVRPRGKDCHRLGGMALVFAERRADVRAIYNRAL